MIWNNSLKLKGGNKYNSDNVQKKQRCSGNIFSVMPPSNIQAS